MPETNSGQLKPSNNPQRGRIEELMDRANLTMLTDFYEVTMANGYLENGLKDKVACFDMFFRKVPDKGGFAIMAGLEQLIRHLQNLRFTAEDIAYLRGRRLFSENFLHYLQDFNFSCDVWSVPEGCPVFPNEPLLTVCGPVIEAQFVETMVLLTINHQSLIATKANRIVRAAQGREVMEFGSRRAHGYDGAIYGARSAYIGGCAGTACTIAERDFHIPGLGTMAHSWIQMFPSELEAFRAYARTYPNNCIFLVDTYNVLKSGVPNAIRVFKEEIVPRGFRPRGIRIDSGDITYLSIEARKMLDEAGFADCRIVASNSLDEYVIRDLLQQGARIDLFGVGERLITSRSEPVFGGVYKLAAVEENGEMQPRIKLSENPGKITNPGFKLLWRLFDKDSGQAVADVLTSREEMIDESRPYELFDPLCPGKRKTITNFSARRLLQKVFTKGACVYPVPSLRDIRSYCQEQVAALEDEVKKLENPQKYSVNLSRRLWEIRERLIQEYTQK
jgi:nicotinate phosphoribosyltransferase